MSTAKKTLLGACVLLTATGCAAFSRHGTPEEQDPRDAQLQEMRGIISSMSTRLDAMESKMGGLTDKVDATQASLEVYTARAGASKSAPGPKKQAVNPHPADGLGVSPSAEPSLSDPDAGFASDEGILAYRKANVLFQAGKYPEAVLAFSNFVERYPDHPLAGSAQYFVGASYLRQKEYRLAQQELERVLTSYDRSPRISETLRDLAETEDALKKPKEAARHRQLLLTMFPQSPAASGPTPEVEHETRSSAHAAPAAKTETPPTAPLSEPGATHSAVENTE